MGGKSEAPSPPDYAGAARATAQGNTEAARIAAQANRVNQVTPYGNLMYSQDPHNRDQWTATQTLTPAQQQLLNRQNDISLGLGGIAQQGLGYVGQQLGNPFDQSKLPASPINAGETAQHALMARLEPSFNRQQDRLETQLMNQGLMRGSEAWKNAQQDLGQQRNDAYMQAALQGINTGQQARQQGIQEQSFFRNEPINTLNAVRTGAQINNPNFVNVPNQATTAGPDLLGAANATYGANLNAANMRNANANSMTGGLMSLAGTLGSAALLASDRRLKTNIRRIGTHPLGIGVYEYDYIWGEHAIGVMADEVEKVKPDAVMTMPNGYKAVYYGRL